MASTATSFTPGVTPVERLAVLFELLAELTGQRNAIDGRIVDIIGVDLPRPRNLAMHNTPEFGRYVSAIRAHFNSIGTLDA